MADVFVSYKKEDRALAQRVVEALEATGFSVWWDDDITPRESWDATIEREAHAAKALVVLWTPKSVASDWVRAEAQRGKDLSKLVPFQMQPCQLPLAFSMIQAADLSGWGGDRADPRWAKAVQWVADQCGRPAPAPVKRGFPVRLALLLGGGLVVAAALAWAAITFLPVAPPPADDAAPILPDVQAEAEPALPAGPLGEALAVRRAFLAALSDPACDGEATFTFDSDAALIDAQAVAAAVDPLIERAGVCEISAVLVEGHADAAEQANGFVLGAERAEAVAALLDGFPRATISRASFGSDDQAVKAGEGIRLAQNRRVVVRLKGMSREQVTAEAYKALGLVDPADRSQPFSKILFGYDRTVFEGDAPLAILATWRDIMAENPDLVVTVTGVAGSDGASDAYAVQVGGRRARAVADYLMSIGADAARIETVALGRDANPLPGADVISRMANRNVFIAVQGQP
jgi:outer membrane protein OmpA-like peptidoglycan-associated protein